MVDDKQHIVDEKALIATINRLKSEIHSLEKRFRKMIPDAENFESLNIPRISRITFLPGSGNSDYVESGVRIELDRPAPAGCSIQFHRYSRKSGRTNAQGYRRSPKAFRRSTGRNIWVLNIPEGATSVITRPIRELYRPPRERGNMRVAHSNSYKNIGFIDHQTPASNRSNKCLYKFSVKQGNRFGEMSAETLEIMYWVVTPAKTVVGSPTRTMHLPNVGTINIRLIATIY